MNKGALLFGTRKKGIYYITIEYYLNDGSGDGEFANHASGYNIQDVYDASANQAPYGSVKPNPIVIDGYTIPVIEYWDTTNSSLHGNESKIVVQDTTGATVQPFESIIVTRLDTGAVLTFTNPSKSTAYETTDCIFTYDEGKAGITVPVMFEVTYA